MSKTSRQPSDEEMFLVNPQGGAIARRNRSQVFFRVVRFLHSLKPYLPPKFGIQSTLDPQGTQDGESVITVTSHGFGIQTPVGEFAVLGVLRRSDIPAPTRISEQYAKALRQFHDQTSKVDPHRAAERFRRLILFAEHFYLAYQDDINRAVGAFDSGDADVLCNVLAAYGPASTEDRFPLEGALQKLASKLAVGDKRAGEMLRRITDVLSQEPPGRPLQYQSKEARLQAKRDQNTQAQQRLSGREYRVRFQAAYQQGKRKLETQRKITERTLQGLKERIVAQETSPHTGNVKRRELEAFARWVEADIVQTLRKNSS